MRKTKLLMQAVVAALLFLSLSFVQAAVNPKFSILPTLKPPVLMPSNGVATAQYLIRNNTSLTRTLVMVPIVGISQQVGNPGGCSYPFTLMPGQSCLLTLQLIGTLMPAGVHSGPIICKTMSPTDNRPDSFLCSQVAPGDNLEVIVTPAVTPVTISVSTAALTFSTVVGDSVTVTNTSTSAAALDVVGIVTSNPNFSVTSNTCLPLMLPGASCTITFNSSVAGSSTAIIKGVNTQTVPISLTAVAPTISVSPMVLPFIAGVGGTVTVTNISGNGAFAQDVGASIPLGSHFFVAANTCPTLLAPGDMCTITFSTNYNAAAPVPIQGTNTNSVTVALVSTVIVSLNVAPNSLNFGVNSTGSVTVTNTSTADGFNVVATVPVGSAISVASTTCTAVLASGASCTITFTSASVATAVVTIAGVNTVTVNLTVSAQNATISASPSPLTLIINDTASVTVTNNSQVTANNVAAYPPVGSTISVVSTTCPAALLPLQSCKITLSSSSNSALADSVLIYGTDTNQITLPISVALATLTLSSSSIVLPGRVLVTNASPGAAQGIVATPPVGSGVVVISGCPSSLAAGASCTIWFIPETTFVSSVYVTIQGTNTTAATLSVAPLGITLSNYNLVVLIGGGTGTIKVTNTSNTTDALNIVATLPVGSDLSVRTNTCLPTLGHSLFDSTCTIEFLGGANAETDQVTIQGSNTNVQNLTVNVVGAMLAVLHVSSANNTLVSDGITPTVLTITNDSASEVSATDLHIELPPSWSEVAAVIDPNCDNLAPGASCTIALTAKAPYLAKKGIIIKGTNTSPVTIDLAFEAGDGLVFDTSEGKITVASRIDNDLNASWMAKDLITEATDANDGSANTSLLLMTDLESPAAMVCTNYQGGGFNDWFLPAKEELNKMYHNLFALGFGQFTPDHYWSSTENDSNTAWLQSFSLAATLQSVEQKSHPYRIRCIRRLS